MTLHELHVRHGRCPAISEDRQWWCGEPAEHEGDHVPLTPPFGNAGGDPDPEMRWAA